MSRIQVYTMNKHQLLHSAAKKYTQMCSQSVSVGVGVVMPEITIENIKISNEMIMFYTGLPDFKTFKLCLTL